MLNKRLRYDSSNSGHRREIGQANYHVAPLRPIITVCHLRWNISKTDLPTRNGSFTIPNAITAFTTT